MAMTICPVAIAVGCRKCPVFKVCPLKSVIGDQPPGDAKASSLDAPTAPRKGAKRPSRGAKRSGEGTRRR